MKPIFKSPAAPLDQGSVPDVDIALGDASPVALPASPLLPTVLRLDPAEVYPGAGPNRLAEAFESDEFAALSDSIIATHGNLQPINIRLLPPDEAPPGTRYKYQLVGGARRLRVCLENKIPVLALLDHEGSLPPEVARAAENQLREPPKPIEFGRQLQVIVQKYPQMSKRSIARIMGRDSAQIQRCLDLAELPVAVLECFASPGDIRTNDATPLKQALQSARDAVLAQAMEIQKGPPLKAGEIVKRLSEAAAAAVPPSPDNPRKRGDESFITPLQVDGQAVGEMKQDKTGRQVITLDVALNDAQRQALNRQLERFVREKIFGGKKPTKDAKATQPVADASPAAPAEGAVA